MGNTQNTGNKLRKYSMKHLSSDDSDQHNEQNKITIEKPKHTKKINKLTTKT